MIRKLQSNGNKVATILETELSIKELELNSLLEVTQAINANLSEIALYKIFHFTLIANLYIPKLALFVMDSDWNCKVNFNTRTDYRKKRLHDEIICINCISYLNNSIAGFEEFNIVIPIAHKTNVLAYVLVGGIEHAQEYLVSSNISFIQTLASIIIVAVENKKLVRKELQQEAFRKEMEIARDVQQMLFPKELPYTDHIKIHATYLPHQSIGGDYYDFIPIDPENYLVCIADVSGKGVSAALLMSNFQACLRILSRQTRDLKAIVKELNHCIITNAKGERFITLFLALCNQRDKTLTYVNAGHNPSFLIEANGSLVPLVEGTTVLGAFNELPFLQVATCDFKSGSLLFSYTDGLTETFNTTGQEYGIERIQAFLLQTERRDLKALHSELKVELDHYRGEAAFTDDITFLSCMLF